MRVYIVVDDEDIFDMKVFQNITEAENYMINYIFKFYEVIPSKEEVLAMIRDNGYFEAVSLIEKEVI